MDDPAKLLDRLKSVRARADAAGSWSARCPAHDDKTPSLSVTLKDGRLLLCCFAGCRADDILRACGLSWADLKVEGSAVATEPNCARADAKTYPTARAGLLDLEQRLGPRTAVWCYRDSAGQPCGIVARWDTSSGKTFRPISRTDGMWQVKAMADPRPLYRLPELKRAIAAGCRNVVVVEGEKACDAAAAILEADGNLTVTTWAGGSSAVGLTDWSPLGGVDGLLVTMVPDNDEPGENAARDAAIALDGLRNPPAIKSARLGDLWPDCPDKGDVADFIESQKSKSAALRGMTELVESAVEYRIAEIQPDDQEKHYTRRRPILVNLGDVQPESISWLWPERIPLGKLSILTGDPGLGKSMITTDIAARLSSGRGWPDGTPGADPGGSVFLSAEDDPADTMRPRFDRAGGDPRNVTLLNAIESTDSETGTTRQATFSLDDHLLMLDEAIRSTRAACRLVVIDPITAYLGGRVDSHRTSDVRGLLAPLSDLAAEHAVSVLLVSHLNKSQGQSALHRSTGSLAFVAAARTAFLCCKDRDDERRRLLLPTKSNLSPRTDGLAFTVQADGPGKPPFVRWEAGPVKVTADEALAPAGEGRESVTDEATEFLRDILADGPVGSKRVLADARELGIPTKTLRRALSRLGGKPTKSGFDGGWAWSLPRTIIEGAQDGPLREGQSWAPSAE